ncbi:hypothetical protein BH11PSE12_BH11PSE12_08180 [soil metagenome]
MTDTIIVTVLPLQPVIKTVLTPPSSMQTKIIVGQGPAGQSMTELSTDPVAYYILAKS